MSVEVNNESGAAVDEKALAEIGRFAVLPEGQGEVAGLCFDPVGSFGHALLVLASVGAVHALLPDGEHFLYSSLPGRNGQFDIYAGSLNDYSRVLVGSMAASPVYAEPGWLLYARQGVLVAQPFDAQSLKTNEQVRKTYLGEG